MDLFRATQVAEHGGDDLHVILKCIVSLMHFLDVDELVRVNLLSRPLAILAKSLRDLGQGSRPPLFFARPKRTAGGRPKDISFEATRGTIAALVAVLIEWGEEPREISNFVADNLSRLGVKNSNGKLISAAQVLRWKYEIGATGATLFQKASRSSLSGYRERFAALAAADPEARRTFALSVLSAIWSKGF